MAKNSLLSTTEPKTQKQSKQTTRTATESQKWRPHGRGEWGRSTGNKKDKWQVQNRQGEVKIV